MKPILVLDTETTGLKPHLHEIIEICMYKPKTGETYCRKIFPERLYMASEKALEVNGFEPQKWIGAPKFEEVAEEIAKFMKGHIVVGHNVSFDLNMLKGNLNRLENPYKIPYHCIDTVTLAHEHLTPMGLKSVSLDNIRKFLYWDMTGAHTAEKDVKDTHELFELLYRMGPLRKLKLRLIRKCLGD